MYLTAGKNRRAKFSSHSKVSDEHRHDFALPRSPSRTDCALHYVEVKSRTGIIMISRAPTSAFECVWWIWFHSTGRLELLIAAPSGPGYHDTIVAGRGHIRPVIAPSPVAVNAFVVLVTRRFVAWISFETTAIIWRATVDTCHLFSCECAVACPENSASTSEQQSRCNQLYN